MWKKIKNKLHTWCVDRLTQIDENSYHEPWSENQPSDYHSNLYDSIDHSHDGGHHD